MDSDLDSLLHNTADIALKRRAKWLISTLKPKKGERILDLGCGDGFYLFLLSNLDLSLNLYGADYDKNALNSARKNLDLGKVNFVYADLMKKLPFPNNFFDGIVMSEIMEHLPDDIKGMREVKRVLKKTGRLLLSVPHINYPFLWDPINWILQRTFKTHIRSGFWAGIWNQHLRIYSEENLTFVLKQVGFRNIKIVKLTHFCFPFNHYLINLGARILTFKKLPSVFKKEVNKFSLKTNKQRSKFSPFSILFKFDKLNSSWDGQGSAVSLVASVIK